MTQRISKLALAATLAIASSAGAGAANYAWPENYEGVMLQGFYWDSYSDTKWTTLKANADEYSQYFSLIWIPNAAKCASSPSMGYDPVYWFSNYNTTFGTKDNLTDMIATYKEKGVGIIADVVVNHRSGVSNWTNFPAETWRGVTYKLGPQHICCTDEVKDASGQAMPTGAADTGEDFNGSRDLDHTSTEVQTAIKAYTTFLLEELGYAGFRYDMVKGYAPQYTKIYNEASKPRFSVGEYFDANYDLVKAWIDGTGKQSAAFDFPFKYAVNDAFHSGDLTKLVWKANGTTDQPAGMIHFGYAQYAVTFIDNHDTYQDGSKFNGNVVAANAFMLCSPGTPCVFLPHYKQNKTEIQNLIKIRNAVGLHNMSAVKVLKTSRDCYMAEVTGSKGKLVVKIGSAMVSPDGYSDSDIVAYGNDYCVWTKTAVDTTPIVTPDPNPDTEFPVYFRNTAGWTTPYIYYWPAESPAWPGVAMSRYEGEVWTYTVPAGTTGLIFNAGDGDATKTSDLTAWAGHVYTTDGDQGLYGGSDDDTDDPSGMPSELYILGNVDGMQWTTTEGVKMTRSGKAYEANVTFTPAAGSLTDDVYFSFVTALGEDWDVVNGSDRYGATAKDTPLALNTPTTMKLFPVGVSASAAYSWKTTAGTYKVTADFQSMTVSISEPSGVAAVEAAAEEAAAEYYTLQGVHVQEPTTGLYIVRRGNKVEKTYIR